MKTYNRDPKVIENMIYARDMRGRGMSFAEIGRRIGKSTERARQLHKMAERENYLATSLWVAKQKAGNGDAA